MQAGTAQRSSYFPYIDGLRAIAVLAVVVYHLDGRYLPGGFAGVDMFFVISGFVVAMSLENVRRAGLHRMLVGFYARRMKRILPALLVCLLCTHIAATLFIPAAWLSDTNQRTGLFALFGLSNFVLAGTGNDYFSPKVDFNPYTHTWSLGVEEQFYLLFPLLFSGWLLGRGYRLLSLGLFVAGGIASLIYAWLAMPGNEVAMFYLLPGRFWELACGVVLYQLMRSRGVGFAAQPRRQTLFSQLGLLVSLAVLVAGFVVSEPARFPYPGALLPALGTLGMLFFAQGRSADGMLMHTLTNGLVTYVGRLSYSLYLWHWPVFVLFRWTVGLESLVTQLTALALVFLLSSASYHLVETPVRRAILLQRLPNGYSVALGLAAVATSWLGYQQVTLAQPQLSQSTVARHAEDWYPTGGESSPEFPACALGARVEDNQGGLLIVYRREGCDAQTAWPHRLFVAGDSHAMAYMPMLKRFAIDTGAEVYVFNNGGCPFMSFQPWRETEQCNAHSRASLAYIEAQLQPGDVFFMPSLRLPRFADQFAHFDQAKAMGEMFSEGAVSGRQASAQRAREELARLEGKGAWVVFEAPKPVYEAPPFRCADWFNRMNPTCAYGDSMDRTRLEHLRAPVLAVMDDLAAGVEGVAIWDPFPLLCPGFQCSVFEQERPLYFDADHLSGYGNLKLYPDFKRYVMQLPVRQGS